MSFLDKKIADITVGMAECSRELVTIDNELDRAYRRGDREIYDKYLELKTQKEAELRKYRNDHKEYCELVHTYSCFNIMDIGNVIADLMTVYEGKKYVYQCANYLRKDVTRLSFDTIEETHEKKPHIVIEESYKCALYEDDKNGLKEYAKNGHAVILCDYINVEEQKIHFYYISFFDKLSNYVGFDYGSSLYVKCFIDRVISYRIENNILSISYKELLELEKEFILSKIKEIEANYRSLEEKEVEMIAAKKEERNLRLRRVLERK